MDNKFIKLSFSFISLLFIFTGSLFLIYWISREWGLTVCEGFGCFITQITSFIKL